MALSNSSLFPGLIMGSDKTVFKWIIPKYKDQIRIEREEDFASLPITMGKDLKVVLTLSLMMNSCNCQDENETIKFFVNFIKLPKLNTLKLKSSFFILNDSNEKVVSLSKTCQGDQSTPFFLIGYLAKSMVTDNLCEGNLILLCEIELFLNDNLEKSESPKDDENNLLKNEEFSDVILQIEDEKIPAHKAVLASRSPVFKQMFLSNMKETVTSEVKIIDIQYNIFMEVLRYIYTGKVKYLNQLAFKILEAAHFYQIDGLMKICEEVLSQNINYDNAIEILKLADKCELEMLKSSSMGFILLHFKDNFQNTPGLTNLVTQPYLLIDIMNQLSLN